MNIIQGITTGFISLIFFFMLLLVARLAFQLKQAHKLLNARLDVRHQNDLHYREEILRQFNTQFEGQAKFREKFDAHQINSLKILQESLQKGFREARDEHAQSLKRNNDTLTNSINQLNQQIERHLKEISGQVEKRLSEGFEKTSQVFTDVVKRLALIDEAQKKITELSTNVVSLQSILSDKNSRGTFGEVQLNSLVRNVLPEKHFAFQHTLSNGKRPDCILFLPEPTGNMVIDSKFPLEGYHLITQAKTKLDQQQAERIFREHIQKHTQDIAEKYIIPGETSEGAVMFIPAEAVFAEIHANHPQLVEMAYRLKVWIASPTTLMAILTTARAVLKDLETQKQVHIIQEHLMHLSKDFDRFQDRMSNLSKHIKQVDKDVDEIHTSSRKIVSRFQKIEKAELKERLPS